MQIARSSSTHLTFPKIRMAQQIIIDYSQPHIHSQNWKILIYIKLISYFMQSQTVIKTGN